MIKSVNKMLIDIDRIIFNGMLHEELTEYRIRNHMRASYRYGITVEYEKNSLSRINQLCEKYGSDKGSVTDGNKPYNWPSHTYADVYELLFRLRRSSVERVLECGIGTNNPSLVSSMGEKGKPGASLRVWRDYFPSAEIIGIDVDRDILFEDCRIRCYEVDQTSSDSIKEFAKRSKLELRSIDIIIDDGLHEYDAGISLFEALHKFLKDDGFYIIEDVWPQDYKKFKTYFKAMRANFQTMFFSLKRPHLRVNATRLIIITKTLDANEST